MYGWTTTQNISTIYGKYIIVFVATNFYHIMSHYALPK